MSKIRSNPVFLIVMLFIILIITSIAALISVRMVERIQGVEYVHESFQWMLLNQLFMGLFVTIAALILSKGRISKYGYSKPSSFPFVRILLLVVGGELILTFIFSFFKGNGTGHFASSWTLKQDIIGVWIIASISEELLTRGLIQSWLEPLKKYKIHFKYFSLTAPVLISGVIFMLMHAGLIATGMDIYLYLNIMLSTLYIGIVAGYFRESTGSLLPAIVIHSLANIMGKYIPALF